MVTNTNGIATQRMHIAGTIIKSLLDSSKLSTKNNAIIATNNFPTTAEGTRFLFLADLTITAPTASPSAVIRPKISPKKLPI